MLMNALIFLLIAIARGMEKGMPFQEITSSESMDEMLSVEGQRMMGQLPTAGGDGSGNERIREIREKIEKTKAKIPGLIKEIRAMEEESEEAYKNYYYHQKEKKIIEAEMKNKLEEMKRELIGHGLAKLFYQKMQKHENDGTKNKEAEEKGEKVFNFKDYAPTWSALGNGFDVYAEELFDWLVHHFGQNNRNMLLSLGNLERMEERGKSKSTFFRTKDRKFVVKSMSKNDDFPGLLKILREYGEHMREHAEDTLLPRFYCVLRPYPDSDPYIIMNDILAYANEVHLKFDFKGTVGAGAARPYEGNVYREYHFLGTSPGDSFAFDGFPENHLEGFFKEGILLSAEQHTKIMETLKRDVRLLSRNDFMDYSLLLAVRFVSRNEESFSPLNGFSAKCNRCRPSYSADYQSDAHLQIFIGLMDVINPFNEKRQKETLRQKKIAYLDDMMDINGDLLEHVTIIPSPFYEQRLLAIVSGCIFRKEFPESPIWIEAVRLGLVQVICQEFGKERKLEETLDQQQKGKTIEKVDGKGKGKDTERTETAEGTLNWLDNGEVQREVRVGPNGKFTLRSFGFGTFKTLMDWSWNTHSWELLTSLADGELEGQSSRGRTFLKTADRKFFVKSVHVIRRGENDKSKPKTEFHFFQQNMRDYFEYMTGEQDRSMLPRYYGLFELRDNHFDRELKTSPFLGKMFLITRNMMPTDIKFNYQFDIKGSTYRQTSDRGAKGALKMLEFWDEEGGKGLFKKGISMGHADYLPLIAQLEKDAKFLMEHNLHDYSFLFGVYFGDIPGGLAKHKKDFPNASRASCEQCKKTPNDASFADHEELFIVGGIIDILNPYNLKKLVNTLKFVVLKERTTKTANSAGVNPVDYYYRLMCAISTKVIRPNMQTLLNGKEEKYCKNEIQEPNKQVLIKGSNLHLQLLHSFIRKYADCGPFKREGILRFNTCEKAKKEGMLISAKPEDLEIYPDIVLKKADDISKAFRFGLIGEKEQPLLSTEKMEEFKRKNPEVQRFVKNVEEKVEKQKQEQDEMEGVVAKNEGKLMLSDIKDILKAIKLGLTEGPKINLKSIYEEFIGGNEKLHNLFLYDVPA